MPVSLDLVITLKFVLFFMRQADANNSITKGYNNGVVLHLQYLCILV